MTMKTLHHAVSVSIFAIVVGLTASVSAGDVVKYSGFITSVADDATTFVLGEIGPWQLRNGATVITHRTITLAPETTFAMITREDEPPSGFHGDFVEIPVGPADVYEGDYVTVACRREGERLVALKITVVELPGV